MKISFEFELVFDQAHADNAWAWSQWAAASCIERHGDHQWMLELHHPEDDSGISLACDYCHTSGYDVWNDFAEWPEGNLDGVQLDDTMGTVTHNGNRAGRVPVRVTLWQTSYYSHYYGSTEYDAGLTLAQLGPIEWEDETEGTQ